MGKRSGSFCKSKFWLFHFDKILAFLQKKYTLNFASDLNCKTHWPWHAKSTFRSIFSA